MPANASLDTSAIDHIRRHAENASPFETFVIDRGQGRENVDVQEVLSDAILIATNQGPELVHVAQLRCFAVADKDRG